MRGFWVAVLLIAVGWASGGGSSFAQATPAPDADQAFYNFLAKDQMARRPTTAKEFRQHVQDACGEYPLRPAGSLAGDSKSGSAGGRGVCGVLVLACSGCGAAGKPAFIFSGVEGIVVGQMDMASNDKMLTRGFGRLFRVMGELCGDYRFTTFSDQFVKPADKLNADDYFVLGVLGVKEYGSELRPNSRAAPSTSIVPARYFDPYEYRSKCKAGAK